MLDTQARGVPVSKIAGALQEQDYQKYYHQQVAFYSQAAEWAARCQGLKVTDFPVPRPFPDFKCTYNWTLSESYIGYGYTLKPVLPSPPPV